VSVEDEWDALVKEYVGARWIRDFNALAAILNLTAFVFERWAGRERVIGHFHLALTLSLLLWSAVVLRRAERKAEALEQRLPT